MVADCICLAIKLSLSLEGKLQNFGDHPRGYDGGQRSFW